MEKRTSIDCIPEKTRNRIRSLGGKLSIEEAIKFIATDLKIAPNCVELVLTTLGYINRVQDGMCYTGRTLKITKYDAEACTSKLTANGLELFYRLVFYSIYKEKPQRIIHPAIFDEFTQPLAELDDKNLVYIDVALDKIYNELIQKYHVTNINIDMYHCMLEDTGKFRFNPDGEVAKCIADIEYYTYYIYHAEDMNEYGVVNSLSINSTEIYISKETYGILADAIDIMFKSRIEAGLFKTIVDGRYGDKIDGDRKCKIDIDDDKNREFKHADKYITLNLFTSMVINNCNNKCTDSDVIKAMVNGGLIEVGKDNRIHINKSNTTEYLYEDQYGNILVRTEKILKLFFIVASMSSELFDAMCDIDTNNAMRMDPYFGMYGNRRDYMVFPMSPMSPMGPMSSISPMQNMAAMPPMPASMTINKTTKSTTTIKSHNENNKKNEKK